MDIFNSGMALAFGQDFQDGQPLRRDLEILVPQFVDHGLKTLCAVSHIGLSM